MDLEDLKNIFVAFWVEWGVWESLEGFWVDFEDLKNIFVAFWVEWGA